MSQRLSNEIAKLNLIALGIPQFCGGEGEDPAGAGNSGGSDGQTTSTTTNDDGDDEDPDLEAALKRKLEGVDDAKDRRIIKLSNENSRRRNEAKTLKDQLAEAQQAKQELDDIKRKENTDLENYKGDLEKANGKLEKLNATLRRTLLKEAIRDIDTYIWHDVGDVVSALDLQAIQVDLEEGKIEGLAEELKRIANAKPHYVKSKKSSRKQDDGSNNGNGAGSTIGASGSNPGGAGSPNNADAARRAALEEKYPVLRNTR